MMKTLPLYNDQKESIAHAALRVVRKLWGPLFALALMINMTILYLKMNPIKFSFGSSCVIPPATPPRDLPFSNLIPSVTTGGIPMIIHQSWKNSDVPSRFKRWQKQWWIIHPQWDYHLWTDEDNRELVKQHYPWFLSTYDALPMGIMRADSVRYMYMHHYGGLYADLDMEPLKSTDALLTSLNMNATKNNAILSYMGSNYKFEHNVPNAWMISKPKHPFWLFCLAKIIELHAQGVDAAEDLTGPVMLYKAIHAYNEANKRINGITAPGVEQGANSVYDLTILKPGLIYPYDWGQAGSEVHSVCWAKQGVILDSTLDEQKCKSLFPDAYAITYWTHSWGI